MKDEKLKKHVIFCLMFGLCLFLAACRNNTINLGNASNAQKLMKNYNIQQNKPTVQKSSGIIIYKDNTTINKTSEKVNFGPKDLDFNMKF